jgi:hypothetical protein
VNKEQNKINQFLEQFNMMYAHLPRLVLTNQVLLVMTVVSKLGLCLPTDRLIGYLRLNFTQKLNGIIRIPLRGDFILDIIQSPLPLASVDM